jgi:hypothetical protein
MKSGKTITFLIIGLIFTIILSFFFTPELGEGDSHSYIRFALKILGENIPENYVSRSPLYPMILSIFIKIFGITAFPRAVVFFQFLLIYFSSTILYLIIFQLLSNHFLAVLAAILFYFNPATIFYGYSIMSEILAVFLSLLSVYLVLLYLNKRKTILLLITSTVVILLILSRFNTLPLIISYITVIIIALVKDPEIKFKTLVSNLFVFSIFPFVVMLVISFHNIEKNGFFGLFPNIGSGLISRNAVLATLAGDEVVKQENKPVLDIFLKAKMKYKQSIRENKKGNLLKLEKTGISEKLYSGFIIYNASYEDLCLYFNLDPLNGESKLSSKLVSFYKEIKAQKRVHLFLQRSYSFLNSFRSSSGISNDSNLKNLRILPEWLILSYKVTFLFVSILTFFFSCIYFILLIFKKVDLNFILLILLVLCYSFYLVNFIFGTVGDANRYKFPSDPLMIGIFIFFLSKIIRYQKGNGITQIFNHPNTNIS